MAEVLGALLPPPFRPLHPPVVDAGDGGADFKGVKMTNKTVDVLVGLQLGSEGKGRIAQLLAHKYRAAVRVGAPNAGHSIWHRGILYKMRTIPCAWINEQCELYIGAGGMINMGVLADELKLVPTATHRLHIDVNAAIVNEGQAHAELRLGMFEKIGSTTEGVGQATAAKMLRQQGESVIAKSMKELQPWLCGTSSLLNQHIDRNELIMIEGTQGYGLSLNHGYYPYVTSRDVLASSMLSDCGLAPSVVRSVIGVMRTFPIRVAGNSGPMGAEELTWEDMRRISGAPSDVDLTERTTVTKRIRRISHMNWDMLEAAVKANRCDEIAITFMDYVSYEDREKSSWKELSDKGREFVKMASMRLQTPVTILSTGPKPEHTIYLDKED